jgi:NADH-quinone oxidoreductase subunit J
LASQVPRLGNWAADSVLVILSAVTVVAAAAAMTMRNPIYCAIWFGMTLVGTAGLFLLQGAEFLAIATVIVYAGAILVTFLFLLMLADPQGRAFYDRTSWEASLSALAGAVIVGILSITSVGVLRRPPEAFLAAGATPDERAAGVLADAHVQGLGQALFERHLIAVEVAGVLLLAALVGAAAMVAHGRVKRPPAVPGPTDKAAAAQSERRVVAKEQPRPAEPVPSMTEQRG